MNQQGRENEGATAPWVAVVDLGTGTAAGWVTLGPFRSRSEADKAGYFWGDQVQAQGYKVRRVGAPGEEGELPAVGFRVVFVVGTGIALTARMRGQVYPTQQEAEAAARHLAPLFTVHECCAVTGFDWGGDPGRGLVFALMTKNRHRAQDGTGGRLRQALPGTGSRAVLSAVCA